MPTTVAPSEIRGPDLAGAVADANSVGLPYVVIGGFAVIAHGYFRATKDSDLLVPDGPEADQAILRFFERIDAKRFGDGRVLSAEEIADAHHLRVDSCHGVIDIMRGGLPPLDYDTAAARAIDGSWRGTPFRVASLRTLVGFKRLANRPLDRVDLEKLSARTASCRLTRSPAWTPEGPSAFGSALHPHLYRPARAFDPGVARLVGHQGAESVGRRPSG